MRRKETRDALMKLIYQMDIHNELDNTSMFETLKLQIDSKREQEYGSTLINQFITNQFAINNIIEANSTNWSMDRISKVDLAILRLSITEILYLEDIPFKVSVNEAVELAKLFSSDDAYVFINGILGKVHE